MIKYSIAVRSAQPGTEKANITETKAYGAAQVSEIVTLNKFAKHIAEHGSVYSRADVQAILILMVDCLREMLLEGKKIMLGDLGNFYVSLSSEGTRKACDFSAKNIKAVNVIWDRGEMFKDLIDDAMFEYVPGRKVQADGKDQGKTQTTIQKGDLE